jgi:predicted metal-dependent HD superfamily phosphohydrolase
MFEQDRWRAAWRGIGTQPSQGLLGEVIARYSEPGRFYHTLQHLAECFADMDSARHLAVRPAEVELAIWFHDAVCDTRTHDCEEKSAQWGLQALLTAGASEAVAGRVGKLILATRHDAVPAGEDARLIVDIDLCILGQTEERFSEYERQVRQEYGWVAEAAFRQGRAQVLKSFLGRPSIYSTSWFSERLEARARANLDRSLRELAV